MTNDEIDILKTYLINEGLRRDTEVINSRAAYLSHKSDSSCMRLYRAHVSKAVFDKVVSDLCTLLNI